ncbi:plasmid stabilization system protein ParE [Rhizobium tibeticum]|nr:plasmid stabilization system protein ParE [Rhizobium tibeticum]
MPRGDKSAYTDKQKRKAEHIEEGYEDRGVSEKEAERRAWATVNKESGGGKKSGAGRAMPKATLHPKKVDARAVQRPRREPRKSVLLPPIKQQRPANETSTTLTTNGCGATANGAAV